MVLVESTNGLGGPVSGMATPVGESGMTQPNISSRAIPKFAPVSMWHSLVCPNNAEAGPSAWPFYAYSMICIVFVTLPRERGINYLGTLRLMNRRPLSLFSLKNVCNGCTTKSGLSSVLLSTVVCSVLVGFILRLGAVKLRLFPNCYSQY
jgi:hypothetical protein